MTPKTLDRRGFNELLIGTAVAALPGSALAARRAVDLRPVSARWSIDNGLTWSTEPVREGTPVLLEATIENIGPADAPGNRPIQATFRFNGEIVSISNDHRGGLATGQQITVRANTGPMGDRYWHADNSGMLSVTVDEPDHFASEVSEENNTTESEVFVTPLLVRDGQGRLTNLGVAAHVAAKAIIGASVAGPVGGILGAISALNSHSNPLTDGPATAIGADRQSGGADWFPERLDTTAQAMGLDPAKALRALREYDYLSSFSGPWLKPNTLIYGDGGLIDHLGGRRNYAYSHQITWGSSMGPIDRAALGLFADNYLNRDRVPVAAGGTATSDGIGVGYFYSQIVAPYVVGGTVTVSGPTFNNLKRLVGEAGARGLPSRIFADRAIHCQSARGLPTNLQPGPTNGSAPNGRNGLKTAYNELIGCATLVPGWDAWVDTCIARSKAQLLPLAPLTSIMRQIMLRFFGDGRNSGRIAAEVQSYLQSIGYAITASEVLETVEWFLGGNLGAALREGYAEQLIDRIRGGVGAPPARLVTTAVELSIRANNPQQRARFMEMLDAYDAWLHGQVQHSIFLSNGRIGWV